MNHPATDRHEGDADADPLGEALADFLELTESGAAVDTPAFLSRYPECATELERCLDDWQQLGSVNILPRPALGAEAAFPRLADFDIVCELGRGGSGVVYKARQRSLQRWVAVKMLRDLHDSARFQNEAAIVAYLDHPHIVPIYDVGTHDGRPYYAMKWIDGGNLAQAIRARPAGMSRAEQRAAAGLVATVALAVHHAHQRGVLHRDLKPSNILLDRAGTAHVTDFGLAKRLDDAIEMTQTGKLVGTPSYMAPEQATGRKGTVTTATDVHGLGALLYALLTGRAPFQGDSVVHTLELVREREPDSPAALDPGLDRDLQTICMKCLEKSPSRRYASAQAVADDLQRWLVGAPIQARPTTGWQRTRRWMRQRPAAAALVVVTAAVLVVLVAGLALYNHNIGAALAVSDQLRQDGLEREAELRRRVYAADMRSARQAAFNGDVAQARALLARHLPAPGDEDLRGFEWHWLRGLGAAQPHTLHPAATPILALALSPDDRWLASADRKGVVRIWDFAARAQARLLRCRQDLGPTDTVPPLPRAHAGEAICVRFSPDGRSLASCGQDSTIRLWDATSWTESANVRGHDRTVTSVAFAPDGTRLASASRDGFIKIWDLPELKLRHGWQAHQDVVQAVAWSGDGRCLASVSSDKQATLWDADSFVRLASLGSNHRETLLTVAFSAKDDRVVTAGYDWVFHTWERSTQAQVSASELTSGAHDVAFAPDDGLLATAGRDGWLALWQPGAATRETKLLRRERVHEAGLRAVVFTSDGQTITTAAEDGIIRIWNRAALIGGIFSSFPGRALDCEPNTGTVVTVVDDGIELRDLTTGQRRLLLAEVAGEVHVPTVDEHARYVAASVGFLDGRLNVWDLATRRRLDHLRGPAGECHWLALAPDGAQLAMGTWQGKILVCPLPAGGWRELVTEETGKHGGVAWSADGSLLAGMRGADVFIWNTRTWERVAQTQVDGVSNALAFSPDNSLLAVGGYAQHVTLWNFAAQKRAYLSGHTGAINSVAFAPDGKTLATASSDRTVRLWHMPTAQELFALPMPAATAWRVAFRRDGRELVATGLNTSDANVYRWRW